MLDLQDARVTEYIQATDALGAFVPTGIRDRAEALESALETVWRDLSSDTAAAYLKVLQASVESLRHQPMPAMPPQAPVFQQVGAYIIVGYLGMGGTGQAAAAYHQDTHRPVCLKLCSGAEGFVLDWLGDDLPPEFLRLYEWNVFESPPGNAWLWVARELADETWHDYRTRLGHRPSLDEALAVFVQACRGVAALHELQVFRWSAHERNVYRVGAAWKLGDLGRCVMAATADDPRFLRLYRAEGLSPVERPALLESLNAGPWRGSPSYGAFLRDGDREMRLRLDDCSMLGGLLVDLLGRDRWTLFYEALRGRSLCDSRYTLTGSGKLDRKLSRVINRAWLGDGGGALAVAAGRSTDAGYSDARELIEDVDAAVY